MAWQRRALTYVDLIPELSFSSKFYARMLKQLRIFPAARLSPESRPTPITSGPPVDALNRIRDKAGGMGQILTNYGKLMFSTGEGTLLALNLNTDDEHWMFVWNDEVKVEMTGTTVTKIIHEPQPGKKPKEYGPEQARAYRMWTPHPRASGEADSPMRSSLDIAEELLALTKSVRATAVARVVNGILLMPIEIAPQPESAEGSENPENDPYIADFTEHMEAQVENAGSASAAAPYINWAAYEYLDRIRLVQTHDPQTDYLERELRKEAVERLARGFDFPPEVLIGLGQTNHWAARQILDEMWRSHGAPIAQQFCDDINDAYLRPTLREENFAGWQDVLVAYDESQVVVQPDRSSDADAAADRGMISDKGYRVLKNIPEEYAPSDDEMDRYLAIKLREQGLLGIEPPAPPPDPERGPPPPGPEGDSGRRTRVVASALAREMGAADMALARCRELAGVRIRMKEKACPECIEAANGYPDGLVAAAVGPQTLDRLSLEAKALVRGGGDTLRSLFGSWGYSEEMSIMAARVVESYAADTLFESRHPTLPSGIIAELVGVKEARDE